MMRRCDIHGRALVQVSLILGGQWICPDCLFTTARSLAIEANSLSAELRRLTEERRLWEEDEQELRIR